MPKKYVSIAATFAVSAVLVLAFQNCGQSPLQSSSGTMDINDDFDYEKQDCDNAESCLMTVTKNSRTGEYPAVEYEFVPPRSVTTMSKSGHINDPLPKQFFRDNQNGSISKCVYNFERSKGRHDYICTREK